MTTVRIVQKAGVIDMVSKKVVVHHTNKEKCNVDAQHSLMERLSNTCRRDMPISKAYADDVRRKAIMGYFKW